MADRGDLRRLFIKLSQAPNAASLGALAGPIVMAIGLVPRLTAIGLTFYFRDLEEE